MIRLPGTDFPQKKGVRQMPGRYIYYIQANLVCVLIFLIMLVHDFLNIDRQEKQIKFDTALFCFILYFISDAIWAAAEEGMIAKTAFSSFLINSANFFIMNAISYSWMRYALAAEQIPGRDVPGNRFVQLLPIIVSTVVLALLFLISPGTLINEELVLQPVYSVIQSLVAYIYIITLMFYTIGRAFREKNQTELRKHLMVGLLPLMVIIGGLVQMNLSPESPIFCFSCTILMLIFYIAQMEDRISLDPLTRLNNRGQMIRYLSQESTGHHKDGCRCYVIMIDVNDFKMINDTFGHIEGDRALRIVAGALKSSVRSSPVPVFIARYGGDEFILIAHPKTESDIEELCRDIRRAVLNGCEKEKAPYRIEVGIGYEEHREEENGFENCIERADRRLYENKEYLKQNGMTTRAA